MGEEEVGGGGAETAVKENAEARTTYSARHEIIHCVYVRVCIECVYVHSIRRSDVLMGG